MACLLYSNFYLAATFLFQTYWPGGKVKMSPFCYETGMQVRIHRKENVSFTNIKKPDMVHTLYPDEIKVKMWRLPVSELFSWEDELW